MASADYHRGDMDIHAQKAMWHGFMRATAFGSALILVLVGYLTLVFAIGMNWFVALLLMGVAGAAIGALMGLGTAWYVSLGVMAAIAVVSRALIFVFSALM